jgi:SAM dependent carboxyl methyltransferase
MSDQASIVDPSIMAGHGYYSANSRPQHAAASVAYPYLAAAAEEIPAAAALVTVSDMGCAGGANEMEPMALAVDTLRRRGVTVPIEVVHTDLPENDFGALFRLLEGPASYTTGRPDVYPFVVGRTLYGPLLPDQWLQLGWSGITLHWLSSMPTTVPGQIYSNLTTGDGREALQQRAEDDWNVFLRERAREMVDGGQIVLVAGASQSNGQSGAEALFSLIGDVLGTMATSGELRRHELDYIFYPTWNRTPEEWLAPLRGPLSEALELVESRLDSSDDAQTFPQYTRDGDAAGFAEAYTRFVRAVTEHPFFRWLDTDRTADERAALVEDFYERLQAALQKHPDVAAVWHVMSLRIRRRQRV